MNKKYLEIQKLIQENRSDLRIAEVLSNYQTRIVQAGSQIMRKILFRFLTLAARCWA